MTERDGRIKEEGRRVKDRDFPQFITPASTLTHTFAHTYTPIHTHTQTLKHTHTTPELHPSRLLSVRLSLLT